MRSGGGQSSSGRWRTPALWLLFGSIVAIASPKHARGIILDRDNSALRWLANFERKVLGGAAALVCGRSITTSGMNTDTGNVVKRWRDYRYGAVHYELETVFGSGPAVNWTLGNWMPPVAE